MDNLVERAQEVFQLAEANFRQLIDFVSELDPINKPEDRNHLVMIPGILCFLYR